ncbi:TIGR03792 family protein [Leptolyngbya iicbica]|uniref:TIGR03792 family protein n=2 Tax=Cyanophyceae TaxID=3028117 RepID=A0A4V2E3M4_9CYAN|nr:TIGR03792 family protein [Leptolyngbya sp. LK]RZM82950.1 TIGR03792 family protein [Leptolyngbya sp. LK]
MVIEWLEIRVPAENREAYIRIDDEIWTPALQQYDGFVAKETWIAPDDPELVIFMIRWETREQWKAIPEDELTAITERFDQALNFDYTMAASKEYQVRRFPVSRESAR